MKVVCVKQGTEFSADYPNKLAQRVSKYLTLPHEVICLTDDARGVECKTQPLPVRGVQGWWNKLALFKGGTFEDGERIVFLDLDIVPVGNLDELFTRTKFFSIMMDANKFSCNSSIMMWVAGQHSDIWNSYWKFHKNNPDVLPCRGDQDWIWRHMPQPYSFLQTLYPGQIVDYKTGKVDTRTRVLVFRGVPRPHTLELWDNI